MLIGKVEHNKGIGNPVYWRTILRIRGIFLCTVMAFSASFTFAKASNDTNYDTKGGAVTFRYKYQKDDRFRVLSTVEEDVYVNMSLDHRATIVNRVSAQITDVQNGKATHDVTFMTSEEAVGQKSGSTFTYGEEYHSIYDRDELGVYDIGDEYFMPTVRDVPVFPEHPVKPGDTWTADGHEAHDLRSTFDLQTPFIIPFTASYKYLGTTKNEQGKTLNVLSINYTIDSETPKQTSYRQRYTDYPTLMMGYSNETVFWDNEMGIIDHYNEDFRIIMETAYGHIYEFRGTAHAETSEIERVNTQDNIDNLQKQVEDLGIENVTVTKGDKGLTISLEKIQFQPESAELMNSEKEKIKILAEILGEYSNNDILVVGHTALAGKAADRQTLSEERAQSVADYLIQLGVRDKYHIFTQGMGSKKPVAPNNTSEGMARNRRVEIILLDK